MEYSHPYEEGLSLPIEGWLHTLVAPESTTIKKTRVDNNQTVSTQQTEHEGMFIEKEGAECWITQELLTAIDSIVATCYSKELQ